MASQSRASLTRSAYLQAEAKLRGDKFLHLPQVTIHYGGASGSGGEGTGGSSLVGSDVDDGDFSVLVDSEVSNVRGGQRLEGDQGLGGSRGRGIVVKKRTEFWLNEEALRRDSLADQGGSQPGKA